MSLREIIDFIESLEKELALFNIESGDPLPDRLKTYFQTQNVRIATYETPAGRPSEIAVLSTESDVLEIIDIDLLRGLVDTSPSTAGPIGIADTEYKSVLGHLKETTFTSYDTEQMLYASREIEDRARRVGDGTIHAGFQRCSVMADQQTIYTDLVTQGLTVHAYGIRDTTPPNLGDGTVHTPDSEEIAKMWFVIFDGGRNEAQKSALIAEEQAEDTFYGAWTYDSEIVDTAVSHLEQTYLSPGDTPARSEM